MTQTLSNDRLSNMFPYRLEQCDKFTSIVSIPGLSRVFKSDSRLAIKLFWIGTILLSVSFGLYNICKTFDDYYQFDVITNVERIFPDNVTFPAITVCFPDDYKKANTSIRDFLHENGTVFKNKRVNITKLEFFKIPKNRGDCVRFNGNRAIAATDRLEVANDTLDTFVIEFSKKLASELNSSDPIQFEVYASDNFLNSYLNFIPLRLDLMKTYALTLVRTEIESQLGEPYNQCQKAIQMNCIEACIYKEIEGKYNCSNPSYYRTGSLERCGSRTASYAEYTALITGFKSEFFHKCKSECPKGCDHVRFEMQERSQQSIDEPASSSRLALYFSDLSTMSVVQMPKMYSFDLVSSVGGLLGLFWGISFLSFAEVAEFIIDVCCGLCIDHLKQLVI